MNNKKKHHFHIGARIIKTSIAVFLSLLVYVILLLIDKKCGMTRDNWKAPSNMYTPFFAGIAAIYATHPDKKSSFSQARIRSIGSIVGGYFGMLLILICEYIFINKLHMDENNFILFKLIEFLIVSLGIIPLILITIKLKQQSAAFITGLTYLSVTISIRNGGMPVFQFATNRILSTLIGVGISLLVNNISLIQHRNKNILFVSSLDNNFLSGNETISPYVKYKLNNLYYKNMNLSFATTRTLSSLANIFNNVKVNFPMVIMNGSAIYNFNDESYEQVKVLSSETRNNIEKAFLDNGLQAFTYTINENIMHCYHNKLINDGEKDFKIKRKEGIFYSFVRGNLPSDLNVSLYIVVDKKEKIDAFIEEINNSSINDDVDLVTYEYGLEDYYYLKINSKDARKENSISTIENNHNIDKLVVCGSGNTDIPLMEQADLSVCLKSAPDYVKSHADYIIDSTDAADVLKLFDKIFQAGNVNKYINKLKSKK